MQMQMTFAVVGAVVECSVSRPPSFSLKCQLLEHTGHDS